MPADSPRMLELRRRVQMDPASIAFAQLAEECRRLGSNEEAVDICRAGLARNPGYLSARVTLGRALIELGQLDAAKAELDIVVAGVPDNLAAIRGLAEILQRRGQMTEALQYYRRALELAKHDPDLEDTVERISQVVTPAPPQPAAGPQASIEEIFNFDTLIDQLGLPPEESPKLVEEASTSEGGPGLADDIQASEGGPKLVEGPHALEDFFAKLSAEPAAEIPELFPPEASLEAADGGFEKSVELTLDDSDSLAIMERELRELEQQRQLEQQRELERQRELEEQQRELVQQRVQDEQRARMELVQRRRTAMVGALETWLSAIVADRKRPSGV